MRQITAIFGSSGLYVILKLALFKDGGIFGKQAKQQPHQIHFQRMIGVSYRFERIVQLAHALGSLDIDRVLRLDDLRLVAGHKAKGFHVLVQILEQKLDYIVGSKVIQTESLKIAHQHITRNISLFDARKVINRLIVSTV